MCMGHSEIVITEVFAKYHFHISYILQKARAIFCSKQGLNHPKDRIMFTQM